MRAMVVERFGTSPVPAEVGEPLAGSGEALLEVRLGALNPIDLKIASGTFYGVAPSFRTWSEARGWGWCARRLAGLRVRGCASEPPDPERLPEWWLSPRTPS